MYSNKGPVSLSFEVRRGLTRLYCLRNRVNRLNLTSTFWWNTRGLDRVKPFSEDESLVNLFTLYLWWRYFEYKIYLLILYTFVCIVFHVSPYTVLRPHLYLKSIFFSSFSLSSLSRPFPSPPFPSISFSSPTFLFF